MLKRSKKRKINKPVIYIKIAFILILLAVSVAIAYGYRNFKKQTAPPPLFNRAYPTSNEILGEQSEKTGQSLPDVPNQINNVSQDFAETLDKTKTNTADKIGDIIYSSAVKPIIDQIKKLPDDKQEEIKKEICR